jgi:hypothetical protein
MTKDIFISYRRHDSSFFAAKLRDRLEQTFPGQVFLDVSGIDAGDDFVETLKSAVSSSKAVVAVIGPGWTTNRDGKVKLGEQGDFVTEEIGTALETGIATVPVLIEGARMPASEDLPPRLHDLPRRNAVRVSHERFDSDANHLVAALYKPLGIQPPNRFERILELAGVGTTSSQKTRDQNAIIALAVAVFGVLLSVQWVMASNSDPLELLMPLAVSALALGLGILGRNSLRRRWAAIGAIAVSTSTLIVSIALGAWRGVSLPLDLWIQAAQVAQMHSGQPEIPAEKIAWSTRAPFQAGAPPTVECACLALEEKPAGARPFAAGARMTFRNRCAGPVTFVMSRSSFPEQASVLAWLSAAGTEFTVISLSPDQSVRVPVGGASGGFYLPWICQKEATQPKP